MKSFLMCLKYINLFFLILMLLHNSSSATNISLGDLVSHLNDDVVTKKVRLYRDGEGKIILFKESRLIDLVLIFILYIPQGNPKKEL